MKFLCFIAALSAALAVFSCRQSDEDLLPAQPESQFSISNLPDFVRLTPAVKASDRSDLCCQSSFAGWYQNKWANFETYAPPTSNWRFIADVKSNLSKERFQTIVNVNGTEPCLATTISLAPVEMLTYYRSVLPLRNSSISVNVRLEAQDPVTGEWVSCSKGTSTIINLYTSSKQNQETID